VERDGTAGTLVSVGDHGVDLNDGDDPFERVAGILEVGPSSLACAGLRELGHFRSYLFLSFSFMLNQLIASASRRDPVQLQEH
jgi:hypothetical protein